MNCRTCKHNASRPAFPAPECLATGTGYYLWCRMVDDVEDEPCDGYEPAEAQEEEQQ